MKFVNIANLKTLIALIKSADESVKNDYLALIGEIGENETVKSFVEGKVSTINDAATTLAGRVSANETAIDTINNTTIDAKITAAFNDFATKVSDDNVVNTFKEMIDYVAAHGTEYANLAALVGTIPTDTTASTVVAYVKELVDAEETRATGIESNLGGQISAEVLRADAAEKANKKAIEDEVARATGVEEGLDSRIEALEGKFDGDDSVASLIATAKSEAISEANNYTDGKIAEIKAYEESEIQAAWNEVFGTTNA